MSDVAVYWHSYREHILSGSECILVDMGPYSIVKIEWRSRFVFTEYAKSFSYKASHKEEIRPESTLEWFSLEKVIYDLFEGSQVSFNF